MTYVGLSRRAQLCSMFSPPPSRTNEPETWSCHDCDKDARGPATTRATSQGLCWEQASSGLQVTWLTLKPGQEEVCVHILPFAWEKAQCDWARGEFGGADQPSLHVASAKDSPLAGRSLNHHETVTFCVSSDFGDVFLTWEHTWTDICAWSARCDLLNLFTRFLCPLFSNRRMHFLYDLGNSEDL